MVLIFNFVDYENEATVRRWAFMHIDKYRQAN